MSSPSSVARHAASAVFVRAGLLALATLLALVALARGAAAQPLDLDAWLVAESESFTMLSDAEPETAAATLQHLERFRAVFARLAPELSMRAPAPTSFYAFRDLESYAPYKRGAERGGSRILGQFVMRPWGNALTLSVGDEVPGASAWAVVLHEYTHYLVTHNFPGAPLWLNEGLAEYYSTFTVDDGIASVGLPVERHLRYLGREGVGDLGDLLSVDSRAASGHGAQEVGRFYGLSWLLAHYLLSGTDTERLDRTADYLARLLEGEDPERAFEDAFDRRLGAMEDELRAYLAAGELPAATIPVDRLRVGPVRLRRAAPATTLTRLGELLVHLGDRSAAEAHAHAALEQEPGGADALALLAQVRDGSGRFDEAEVLWREALAAGLARPQPLLFHALHALTTAGGERAAIEAAADAARESLGRALDAMPSYAQAWALLARAEMLPGGGADRARRAVAEARTLLPDRLDLVALEVEVLLHDAVDGMVLGPLDEDSKSTPPDPSAVERADALLERVYVPRAELSPAATSADSIAALREQVERTRLLVEAQLAFLDEDPDTALDRLDRAVSATSDESIREALEAELDRLTKLVEGGLAGGR